MEDHGLSSMHQGDADVLHHPDVCSHVEHLRPVHHVHHGCGLWSDAAGRIVHVFVVLDRDPGNIFEGFPNRVDHGTRGCQVEYLNFLKYSYMNNIINSDEKTQESAMQNWIQSCIYARQRRAASSFAFQLIPGEDTMVQRVRLFRRMGKSSFAVQLSPTSGVVEVHCGSIDVIPNTFAAREELEESLQLLLKKKKKTTENKNSSSSLGGFEEGSGAEKAGSWEVGLRKLGPYSMDMRGFVQCSIVFVRRNSDEQKKEDGDEHGPCKSSSSAALVDKQKKKYLQWVQIRSFG